MFTISTYDMGSSGVDLVGHVCFLTVIRGELASKDSSLIKNSRIEIILA